MRRVGVAIVVLALALPARASAEEESRSRLDTHTTIILAGSAALIIGWDLYLAAQGSRTESELIKNTAWKANLLPFACGVFIGHWFLLRGPDVDGHGPTNSLPAILAAVAAVAVWDLAWNLSGGSRYALVRHPAIWAGLGVVVGGVVWSQRF